MIYLSNMIEEVVLRKFVTWIKLKVKLHIADINFYFHEREIWWASLGANVGYEQDGKNKKFERPVLIVKKFNSHLLWVLPLTSTVKEHKYYFRTMYENREYCIILSQIRTISSKRLLRKIRTLPVDEFEGVKEKIRAIL